MPDLDWNKSLWGGGYDWSASGEEWSGAWGGSEAQWFGTLYPRLHRLLPAGRILEIAPGFGRWSKFLIPSCTDYLGIDLAQNCIDASRAAFAAFPHARFAVNDGVSLEAAEDGAFDLVFCFDSLVHAEADVLRAYVPQILAKLSPRGCAFVHHSNLNGLAVTPGRHTHFRAPSVSGALVEAMVREAGGEVAVQEVVNWPSPESDLIDCFTTFRRRRPDEAPSEPVRLVNTTLVEEARIVAAFQAPYRALA